MTITTAPDPYPARLDIDYQEGLSRVKTLFRLVLIVPIAIVIGVLATGAVQTVYDNGGNTVSTTSGGIAGSLFLATLLMILFRHCYPRLRFAFACELVQFGARVSAYFGLLTDRYPSTVKEQAVHVEIDYPDVEHELNRWMPLVKWLPAIPHFVVLFFLSVAAFFAVISAWFAILVTGRYPRELFDFVVGVGRWSLLIETSIRRPPPAHRRLRSGDRSAPELFRTPIEQHRRQKDERRAHDHSY